MKNDREQPMKSELSGVHFMSVSAGKDGDASKLVSLLALASGALAMPQTGHADIIFTDLSTNQISVGVNNSPAFTNTLPGTARLGFGASVRSVNVHFITAGQKAGYVRLKTASSFVIPVGAGMTWDQVIVNAQGKTAVQSLVGSVATANPLGHKPNSFDHLYFPFIFKDSTVINSPTRYGWIEVSLSNPANNSGPDVTIFGYAYDDTGAHLATGVVPEPASMTLLALGALALGAKGLRSWRRNRRAANPVGMAR